MLNFILAVLGLLAETDCYDGSIWWRCDNEYAPITFWVMCNDLFYWATADGQRLNPEDLPALRQAIADSTEIDRHCADWGFLLWVARKRGMRPQQPAYPKDERLRALFDACGPERSRAEEG